MAKSLLHRFKNCGTINYNMHFYIDDQSMQSVQKSYYFEYQFFLVYVVIVLLLNNPENKCLLNSLELYFHTWSLKLNTSVFKDNSKRKNNM